MLTLTVIQGPDKGKTFALPLNEPQLIGRSSEALPTTDNTVSRRHAELTPDEGEWFIRDLESQNGTYVNGVQINDRLRLRLGDQIRTGSTLWMYGRREDDESRDVIRVVRADQMDTQVERTMASNDDSVILAEPEPRTAAVHHLQVIYRLTALTAQTTVREELLAGVMELVFNEFQPERGFILLNDEPVGPVDAAAKAKGQASTPRPVVVKYRTPPKDRKDARIHVSKTILQHAMTGSEGVLSSNAMTDPRFAKGDSVQQFHIRSALCSPIEFGDRKFGAIYVDSSIANYTFTPEQLALLNAIARHTGLALANAEGFAKRLQTERLAAIGETVASLSHSIKNILQGLRGGADVVDMGLRKEDLKIARGGWAILKRNIDRIMGLTLNMLAYSARRTLEYELIKVGPLLEDCAQLLHDQSAARGVALIIDVDPEMPPVQLDQSLMHQALMNLMGNAVEAVDPETGAVTVKATYLPAQGAARPLVRIDVIDNGPGIAPDRQQSIFQPFQTSKGLRGTGLGLAVTKRIIEEHGGRIRLESAEGRGATFTVVLPADGQRIDPSATAASRTGSPEQSRVL